MRSQSRPWILVTIGSRADLSPEFQLFEVQLWIMQKLLLETDFLRYIVQEHGAEVVA